jgi:DnaJ-class molecular chaperone
MTKHRTSYRVLHRRSNEPGRKKCDKCKGKGGYTKIGSIFGGVWIACIQCGGKGSWWPNNTSKK